MNKYQGATNTNHKYNINKDNINKQHRDNTYNTHYDIMATTGTQNANTGKQKQTTTTTNNKQTNNMKHR